jgi:hypothetical protein
VHFRKDDFDASYFSIVSTLGTPQDVTLQEIRIECFFPADISPPPPERQGSAPPQRLLSDQSLVG